MKSAPSVDPNSPFGKFQEAMRGLLKVKKTDLDEQLRKHDELKGRRAAPKPKQTRRVVD